MLRQLVVIYVTFVLVAGPSLCCCVTMSAQSGLVSASSERVPPCCGKHHAVAKLPANPLAPKDVGIEPSQNGSQHDKHHCPCQDNRSKQLLDKVSPWAATAQDLVRLLSATLQPAFVAFTDADSANSNLDCSGGSPPSGYRITSWRLLQAHHLLRC